MQKVQRPPRLTMDEWKAFGRVCKQLDALAAMLHASTWNGKGLALVALAQAYEPIALIYNRIEAVVYGLPWPPPTETPRGESGEGGTGESSSSAPSAAPGSLET